MELIPLLLLLFFSTFLFLFVHIVKLGRKWDAERIATPKTEPSLQPDVEEQEEDDEEEDDEEEEEEDEEEDDDEEDDDDEDEEEQKFHQGLYKPKTPSKYRGDLEDVNFRSHWELIAFKWCDYNYGVVAWASEELAIPYYMKKVWYERNYFPDLLIYFKSGETLMVEIKPNHEKMNPSYQNKCKWAAARAHCKKKDWTFQIWDEATIEKLRPKVQEWEKARYRRRKAS